MFNRTVALRDTWAKIEKQRGEIDGDEQMIILGIGGILGDAASAILKDGKLMAAIEESKLVRRRTHWGGTSELPEHSIASLPGTGWRQSRGCGRGGDRAAHSRFRISS